MHRKRKQKGYATLLTLVLFVVIALSAFSMYDVGQVSADRIRLQNTNDAAVHGAAVLMARDFNFIAYTNRAMIANQATVGQLVALSSWTTFMKREAENLDTIGSFAQFFPGGGTVFKAMTLVIKNTAEGLSAAVDSIAPTAINILDEYIGALSRAQSLYHEAAYIASGDALTELIKLNDPDVDYGLSQTIYDLGLISSKWSTHTVLNRRELTGTARNREFQRSRFQEKTALVTKSTDLFTSNRQDRWFNRNIAGARVRVDKRGATNLDMLQNGNELAWNWTSMDTESLWVRPWLSSWREAPIGWGAAHALHQQNDYRYPRNERRWGSAWSNRRAARLAVGYDARNNVTNISGLRNYNDFAQDRDPRYNSRLARGATSRAPGIVLHLAKSSSKIGTRKTFVDSIPGNSSGATLDVEEHGGLADNKITSLAKAETYFSRPNTLWARADRRIEHGNLYSPYWQARLVEPDIQDRITASLFSKTGLLQ